MKESNTETLVEVRDIIARIHDNHVTARNRGRSGLSDLELAAIRDSLRRINDVISSEGK